MPKRSTKKARQQLSTSVDDFNLETFFPYQVRRFYSHVTTTVSQCYTTDYGMSRPDWRTMATLGLNNQLTSAEIADSSSMDKVSVSRAVSRLDTRGWLRITQNSNDGRSKLLQLSASGQRVYRELVPKVVAAEKALLRGLTDAQIKELRMLMEKIGTNKL